MIAWLIRFARWLIRMEISIWRSLSLWVARRIPGDGLGVQALAYGKDERPLLLAFIFLSAIEIPVVHLLLPWEAARLTLLALGVWGLLWMLGRLAAMKVHPPLIGPDGLRIRYGTFVDLKIPWDHIEDARLLRASVASKSSLHVAEGQSGAVASVPVMRMTRIAVRLRLPLTVPFDGGTRTVREVRLHADDPAAYVAAVCRHLLPA